MVRRGRIGRRSAPWGLQVEKEKRMSESISTICVQGGYRPGDAEPRQVPIYQSTTWKYDTSEHMGKTQKRCYQI